MVRYRCRRTGQIVEFRVAGWCIRRGFGLCLTDPEGWLLPVAEALSEREVTP